MSQTDRFSIKEAVAAVVVLAIVGAAMYYTLTRVSGEGEDKRVEISNLGDDNTDRIEAFAKILSIDPIKGDMTVRIEFDPSDSVAEPDGTLKEDLRVYTNSANGKQETDFSKGKRLTAVEGVFNLQAGNATEYPFDRYIAEIDVYVARSKPAPKKPAPAPAARDDEADATTQTTTPDQDGEDSDELPLSVDFEGSIPGYNISAAKAEYTDESFVGVQAGIERAATTKFFSIFVSVLMWILSIGVLLLTLSVVLRGRKVELAMFSFMATLLFAFYAVRNSQPNVPPIGVFSDFAAFFWVEVIVATCLVVTLVTWLFRTAKP